ncbi:microtubule-associated protein 9-like [Xyrichtys novacula]|uniref:Microtubule-associated protein 9-like n=1 Tax=Xyrichtys novacula TaxID=13765 RepID=A0AAV1ETW4_XYRNO|nr:microtubule-associated protein 9-like [Xyrichtys novacula]
MTSEDFMTLAYTKSPKTSRRTTFQDELKAAVSARANKPKTDHSSYSDDFNEDEDDFLNKLLKSRKKKTSALRAEKSKTKINDFELSDDESKHSRTKRVSFLKTQRISSSSSDTTASHEKESLDQPASQNNDHEDSWFSQLSTPASEGDVPSKSSNVEFSDSQISRQSSSRSLSYQTSGDTLLDMPLPLPSDNSGTVTPEKKSSSPQTVRFPAAELKYASSADSTTEREPPRPKPRQRTLGLNVQVTEKIAEDAEPEALSGAQTSSASIPVSTDTDGTATWTDKEHTVSRSFSKSSSSKSDLSQLMTKSTVDSGSRKSLFSDDSKEEERKYSTSFEELNQDSEDHSDQPSHVQEKASDGRTPSSDSKTTQRSQSTCSKKVESKYLGSLKVLDRRVSLQESQPQEAASMRAAVYQEWLKKKKEKSRENMQLKKKEATLEEKKKMEEEAKKGDAVASYQAWKERKANSLRAKAKEKQETIRKEQKATEEKEEKRQSAKQVFEKWKQEHDHLLKEKHRKQREAEKKQKLKTQEKEEERKRDSKSAFNNWNEKKKDVLHEKTVKERKEIRTKAEEEHYMKEERDSMASEMYENWLVRKDLEQRRKKEERRIQEILRDSPPPPWSPPNKTIPFRK